MIYFVEAVGLNLVKIGFTEKEPQFRFYKMQADSPVDLRLLGTIDGDRDIEAEIQTELASFRVRGEWFALSKAVKQFVESRVSPHEKPALTVRSIAARDDGNAQLSRFYKYLAAERGRSIKLAASLGITPGAICQWSRVPANRVLEVERITGIPKNELRPDIFKGFTATPAPSQAEVA